MVFLILGYMYEDLNNYWFEIYLDISPALPEKEVLTNQRYFDEGEMHGRLLGLITSDLQQHLFTLEMQPWHQPACAK